MKKNSCTPINPKKIFILWPKKNSYEKFDNEKNFCGSKIPLPPPPHPITFLVPKAHVHDEIFWSLTLIRIVKVITTNLNG